MARLIDADALKKALMKPFSWNNSPEEIQEQADFNYFEVMIDAASPIDAVPVVHARWMRSAGKSHIWYCSACGDKINYKQNRRTYNIPKVPVEQKNKFCRNCGAKMDGGAEDENP